MRTLSMQKFEVPFIMFWLLLNFLATSMPISCGGGGGQNLQSLDSKMYRRVCLKEQDSTSGQSK